jgi:tetratricopeptide (TPR) repeat protein
VAAGKSTRRQPPPRPVRLQRERRLSSVRGTLWTNLPAVAPESLAGLRADVRQAREEYRLAHYEDAERALARPLRALPAMARGTGGDAPKATTSWASAWSVLARTRDKLGHPRQAHAAFERAVQLFEGQDMSQTDSTGEEWLDYGIALEHLGRNDEALAAFRRAQELGLLTSESYRHIGFALLSQDPVEAEECFRVSKELAPEDPYALRVLAEHLKRDRAHEAQDLFRDAGFASGTKGDIDEALELFAVALELDPNDPNALAGKAEMLRVLDDCEAAIPLFERSLALTPNVPWIIAGQGAAMHRLGDHQGALTMLDATLALAPDFLFAIGTKGRVLRELGRLDESATLLRTVQVDDPSSAWVLVELAETDRLRGDDTAALDALNRALDLVPSDPAARAIRAAVHLGLGNREKAWNDIQRSLELGAHSAFAQTVYGQVLYDIGRFEEAAAAFQKAVSLDPASYRSLTWLGEALRLTREFDQAVEAFDAALALEPDFSAALAGKGAVLYLLERYEDALEALEKALRLEKNRYPFALTARGRVLRRLGRAEEAERSLRDSLALDALQPLALTELAELVHADGRVQEALELSQRALEFDQNLVPALLARANALRAMGRYGDAVAPLERATEVEPDDAWSQAVLGDTLLALGHAHRALAHLDNALELEPGHVFALATKGQALRLQRNLNEAIVHLREAIERAGESDATGWIHTELGEALRLSNRYAEALDEFGQALKLDPNNPWALAGYGSVLQSVQRYPEALELLDRALGLARTRFALVTKAIVLIDIGRYREAIELLDEVSRAGPPDGWVLRLKGWAAELLEEGDMALAAYREALNVEPSSEWAERGVAEALLLLGDRDAALAGFRRIVQDASSAERIDPSKMMLVGWGYLRMAQLERKGSAQHYKRAINCLGTALALEEDVVPVQFDIALAQMSSGQYERGCQAYRRGIASAFDLPPLRRWAVLDVARNDLGSARRLVPKLARSEEVDTTIEALKEGMAQAEAEALQEKKQRQEEKERQEADPAPA